MLYVGFWICYNRNSILSFYKWSVTNEGFERIKQNFLRIPFLYLCLLIIYIYGFNTLCVNLIGKRFYFSKNVALKFRSICYF